VAAAALFGESEERVLVTSFGSQGALCELWVDDGEVGKSESARRGVDGVPQAGGRRARERRGAEVEAEDAVC
jgi:hypothetical protein